MKSKETTTNIIALAATLSAHFAGSVAKERAARDANVHALGEAYNAAIAAHPGISRADACAASLAAYAKACHDAGLSEKRDIRGVVDLGHAAGWSRDDVKNGVNTWLKAEGVKKPAGLSSKPLAATFGEAPKTTSGRGGNRGGGRKAKTVEQVAVATLTSQRAALVKAGHAEESAAIVRLDAAIMAVRGLIIS